MWTVRTAARVWSAIVGAVLVGAVLVPSAQAVPPAPVVDPVRTSGQGPDDLMAYSARGFPTLDPVSVSLDGVGTAYHAELPTLTPGFAPRNEVFSDPAQRTPSDLLPGQYTVTFTQPAATEGGDPTVLTSPAFTIVAPSLVAPVHPYHPGETVYLYLHGLGAGSSVHRTITVDGSPVAGTPPREPAHRIRAGVRHPAHVADARNPPRRDRAGRRPHRDGVDRSHRRLADDRAVDHLDQ